MDTLNTTLKDVMETMLPNDQKNTINPILKVVYEALMQAERELFLQTCDASNKGNGYYERTARGMDATIKLDVPRDRQSIFRPAILEAIDQADEKLDQLAAKLYVKGLTTRDIEDVLGIVFGKKLSPTSVSNITKEFEKQRKDWLERPIEENYYFIFVDALWVSVRRGDRVEKEAFYTMIGLREDLKRDILGLYNIPSESAAGWREALIDLKRRGVKNVLLFIADGLSGLNTVIGEEFPQSSFQRCIVHKFRNILLGVRASDKALVIADLRNVFVLGDPRYTIEEAKQRLEKFINTWGKKYPGLHQKFKAEDVDNYFAYLLFPYQIHRMIYTTNWSERLNKTIRRTQRVRNAFPSPESAMALITACLIEQEENFYLRFPLTKFTEIKPILDEMIGSKNETQFS